MTHPPRARGHATRTANKLRRRARILDSARAIIAAEGYDALTLSQLARRAEVTVPTIHNLLGRKSDIIEAIVGDVVTRLVAVLDAQDTAEPVRAVEAFTDALARLYGEDEALYKSAFVAGERAGLFRHDAPGGIHQRSLALACRVCSEARARGELRGDIATDLLAAQAFGAQRLARLDWVSGYIDLPTYVRRTRNGIFIALASDATPAFRARLLRQIAA